MIRHLQSYSHSGRLEKGFCENAEKAIFGYSGITRKGENAVRPFSGITIGICTGTKMGRVQPRSDKQACRNVVRPTAKTFVRTHYRCVATSKCHIFFLDHTGTVTSLDSVLWKYQEVKFIQTLARWQMLHKSAIVHVYHQTSGNFIWMSNSCQPFFSH